MLVNSSFDVYNSSITCLEEVPVGIAVLIIKVHQFLNQFVRSTKNSCDIKYLSLTQSACTHNEKVISPHSCSYQLFRIHHTVFFTLLLSLTFVSSVCVRFLVASRD